MSSQYSSDEVTTALVTVLAGLQDQNNQKVYIDNITENKLDAEDTVSTKKLPCVFIMFINDTYQPSRDITRCTYTVQAKYVAIVGWRSLRTESAEQLGALKFLAIVKDKLAGQRLTLASNSFKTEPITLEGSSLLDMSSDGTWYQLDFYVGGVAQFTQKP